MAGHARPLADCGPDELWRGRLHLALAGWHHVKERLDQADRKLDALARDDDAVRLLQTIPGVGPRTAEAVAAFLPRPELFRTTKQVSAYGGFVPRQYQSSETDQRGRITKRGPRTLRKLLVECAWVMLRYNRWARAIYQRLTHGGKAARSRPSWPWRGNCWCVVGPCCATAQPGVPIRCRPKGQTRSRRRTTGGEYAADYGDHAEVPKPEGISRVSS